MTRDEQLTLEIERLKAELRHRPRTISRSEQIRKQTRIDARFIAGLRAAGLAVSRREAVNMGMSERRWRRAYKYLRG